MPAAPHYTRWKGLSAGATAESVALHAGRPIIRPLVLPNKDTYSRSIERFTAHLKREFKQLAQARVSPSYLTQVAFSQGLQSIQRPALVPGMSAAIAGPAATSAHNLTAGFPGRPAASFSAAPTPAAFNSFVPSAGLATAAGSQSIPFGQAVASTSRPASMAHSSG